MKQSSALEETDPLYAMAAPIEAADPSLKSADAGAAEMSSERLLWELSRFVERASRQSVQSPTDRAILRGAQQTFAALIESCDQILAHSQPTSQDRSNASYFESYAAPIESVPGSPYTESMLGLESPAREESPPAKKLSDAEAKLAQEIIKGYSGWDKDAILHSAGPKGPDKLTKTTKKRRTKKKPTKKSTKRKSTKKKVAKKQKKKKTTKKRSTKKRSKTN